ncbi:hypothetical protein PFISCL1PPCAC_11649, partial [Pristionchus fissidentatus]
RLFSSLTKSTKNASVLQDAKQRDLLLHRHSDLASIDGVMQKLTENGKFDQLANNATFLTTLQLAKTTSFDHSRVSYFTEDSGRYLVLAEENEHQFPWISLRLPSDGQHDHPLLRDVISEILECHLKTIAKRKEFVLDCDSVAMETVLEMLGKPKFVPDGNFAYFHMNDKQCSDLMKKTFPVPEGFAVKCIQEKDYQLVIEAWDYCDSHVMVKKRLRHLPSVGIYTNEGQLASFMSTHTMGQMSHLYTLPEFRGLGLGKATE